MDNCRYADFVSDSTFTSRSATMARRQRQPRDVDRVPSCTFTAETPLESFGGDIYHLPGQRR